jgi:hypothetical protein
MIVMKTGATPAQVEEVVGEIAGFQVFPFDVCFDRSFKPSLFDEFFRLLAIMFPKLCSTNCDYSWTILH